MAQRRNQRPLRALRGLPTTGGVDEQVTIKIKQWTCRRMSNMVQGQDGKWRIVPGTKYLSLSHHRPKFRAEQCQQVSCTAWIPKHGNRKYCAGCREARYREDNAAAKERMRKVRNELYAARNANYAKLGRPIPERKAGRPLGATDLIPRKGSFGYRPGLKRKGDLRSW